MMPDKPTVPTTKRYGIYSLQGQWTVINAESPEKALITFLARGDKTLGITRIVKAMDTGELFEIQA